MGSPLRWTRQLQLRALGAHRSVFAHWIAARLPHIRPAVVVCPADRPDLADALGRLTDARVCTLASLPEGRFELVVAALCLSEVDETTVHRRIRRLSERLSASGRLAIVDYTRPDQRWARGLALPWRLSPGSIPRLVRGGLPGMLEEAGLYGVVEGASYSLLLRWTEARRDPAGHSHDGTRLAPAEKA